MDSEALERDYCPPLDVALFSAIVSDYDLQNAAQLTSAREILDSLKASAIEEETSSFDPSGGHVADTEDNDLSEMDELSSQPSASRSAETDSTSLSNGIQFMTVDDDARNDLDNPTKIKVLMEMFPTASEYTIRHSLKKCNYDYPRALDELLNHTFFNDDAQCQPEDRILTKGVDAFSEDGGSYRSKKRNRSKQRLTDNIISDDQPMPKYSSWDQGKKDVDLISSRTGISVKTVSSMYHQHGTSLTATLIGLIESSAHVSGSSTPADDDPMFVVRVHELAKDFPSILPVHVRGLIRLTHPSEVAAHELAKAMTAGPAHGRIQLIPSYAPVNVSDDEDLHRRALARRSHADTGSNGLGTSDYRAMAANHHNAAQQSFSQASAAYRRGRSDHLMGAAAGYYSQLGRDHATRRSEATAGAADALVASQSSATEIDLHGVSVRDAVRIARTKTETWYKSANRRVMGFDGRMRNDDATGGTFTIVTGLGRHSEGGRGKLGPAVGKMLLTEGWHVSFGEGTLTVSGRKR